VNSAHPADATAMHGDDGPGAAGSLPGQRGAAGDGYDGYFIRPSQPAWERLARRAAHGALVTAGQPTRRARMLPGFLIAGAERCGTTTMFHVLRQHPAVFNPILPRKELHYFDQAYDHGLGWYQCHFPLAARARLLAGRAGAVPVAFEATPSYMFHPLAPERIQRDLPGVRLLVMLRDPVERAYSAHALRVGRGYETESFERALELEDARLQAESRRLSDADSPYSSHGYRHFSYRARGHYAEQLERIERLFGRDRIHVIDSGDFFATPEPVYDQVLDFLGLPHRGYPSFRRRSTKAGRSRTPISATVRARLEEHYRPHDERLAAWLGREPSWRR
jgi:Sulfotransferase domain